MDPTSALVLKDSELDLKLRTLMSVCSIVVHMVAQTFPVLISALALRDSTCLLIITSALVSFRYMTMYLQKIIVKLSINNDFVSPRDTILYKNFFCFQMSMNVP